MGANLQKLNLDTVDILLPLEKCYVGPRTEEALKNLSVYDAKIEREKMQKHYIEIAKYFQKMFPLNSHMLRDLSCLHPEIYMKTATVRSIERLAKLVPHVISAEDMPKIVDEWKALQAEAIDEGWYQEEVVDKDGKLTKKMIRVDHFWRKVFKIKLPSGDLKYATLPKLIKTLLCIHHENFDCERSLSDNNKVVTNNRISL